MSKVDLQRMLDSSVAYFLAGERCSPDLTFGRYGNHSLCSPVITCYSFSLEIILKLHIYYDSKNPKNEHNIINLYNTLSDEIRSLISESLPKPHLQRNIADIFSDYSNAFSDWRYAYEKSYLECWPSELRHAFIACHRAFRELYPDQMSIYERNFGGFSPDPDWAWYDMEMREVSSK